MNIEAGRRLPIDKKNGVLLCYFDGLCYFCMLADENNLM